MIKKSY